MIRSHTQWTTSTIAVTGKTTPAQPRFGYQIFLPDSDNSDPEIVLRFYEPKPNALLQKFFLLINRLYFLQKDRLQIPPDDLQRLRSLPKNAGNILIGPHPDMSDGFVLLGLFQKANRLPAGFFTSSEVMEQYKLLIPLFSRLGAIPVKRGQPNPKAVDYMVEAVASGKWSALLPEGSVYWSREVMAMEYGATKVAVEAALKNLKTGSDTPVFITPFAHVYEHRNQGKMIHNMSKALSELERLPELADGADQKALSQDSLEDRMVRIAERILEHKSEHYQTRPEDWDRLNLYQRAETLQRYLLEGLEQQYRGKTSTGNPRRRSFKIRMMAYEKLKQLTEDQALTPELEEALRTDIQKTRDIVTMSSFHPQYIETFKDRESQGEFLRRFRDMMGLTSNPFGRRDVHVKVLEPVNMMAHARHYDALASDREKRQYLFDLTQELQERVQQAIHDIHHNRIYND